MTDALSLSDSTPHFQVDVKNFLARTYLDAKKFDKAEEMLDSCYAQAKAQKFLDAQKESCLSLVRLYQALNDDISLSASAELAELMLQQDDKLAAIEYAKRLLAIDTLCEKGYEILFLLHYQAEDFSAIKTLYETCKAAYKKELGTAPPKRFERFLK